jgi:hypothetical protein
MISSSKLTFGSDPEVFAYYSKNNLEYVEPPAYFRFELGVPHKPDKKHPVFIEKDGIVVMEDGVAFEYTLPPTTNAKDLFAEIKQANSMLSDMLAKHNYNMLTKPVINYEVSKWLNKPEDYSLCLIFGCDPDEDAIEDSYNCTVENALLHEFRYGGGHFQIGSFDSEVTDLIHAYWKPLVRLMAVLVGTVSIKHTPYPELEKQRAFRYGRPGRYRIQKWGLEYRTPSNSWINKEEALEEMVEGARKAFELLQNPKKGRELLRLKLDDAIQAIRTADSNLANQILNDAKEF